MKNRKYLMAANWKMNLSLDDARALIIAIKRAETDFNTVDVLIAPPFTALALAYELLAETDIFIAGQNMHWETGGAFTGEISPLMLKEAGCTHVILGHSERRSLFYESSAAVNKKAIAAINAKLTPIVCIGESLSEREDGKTFDIIKSQLNESLEDFRAHERIHEELILAYEPVWAIGTGKTATPAQAQEVHSFIRNWVTENIGSDMAQDIRILYGGSVKPDNIKELMEQPDIDGALIGGASLKADSFISIIHFYEN
jgi:triosephosphate isomerase (TIM)